ncbi:Rieske 2Fe-2S domain-containing protein [bacterium]|nr:Rieske 2Fe-2S domain-containing protein [bacterium]
MPTKIASVKDIPAGECIPVDAPDGRSIALYNVDGQIYAMNGVCPHAGGPLGEGSMEGSVVTCPWHGWSFDVKTGACENNPDVTVECPKITVVGDDVLVD